MPGSSFRDEEELYPPPQAEVVAVGAVDSLEDLVKLGGCALKGFGIVTQDLVHLPIDGTVVSQCLDEGCGGHVMHKLEVDMSCHCT